MRTITVTHTTDENGRDVVLVPLSTDQSQSAIVYEQDWDELMALGVPPSWQFHKGNLGKVSVRLSGKARATSVARVIMDAGPKQVVHFVKDGLDLRRENLVLANGQGKYRARDMIEPRFHYHHKLQLQHIYKRKTEKPGRAMSG